MAALLWRAMRRTLATCPPQKGPRSTFQVSINVRRCGERDLIVLVRNHDTIEVRAKEYLLNLENKLVPRDVSRTYVLPDGKVFKEVRWNLSADGQLHISAFIEPKER